MIASIADAIAGVVEQEDFVYGWRVSVAGEPVGPDDAITFYDTGGNPAIQTGINLREPSIQVRVRARSYVNAMDMQQQIHRFLSVDNTEHTVGGGRVVGAWLQSDIMSIGRDDANRYLTTSNYRVIYHDMEVS